MGHEISLCNCTTAVLSDGILSHVLVKIIEVLGANIAQLQIADCLVDSGQHIDIPIQGACFHTDALLHLQHILGILRKGLGVVQHISIFDLFLEFVGSCRGLFQHLLVAYIPVGWNPQHTALDLLSLPVQPTGDD